MSILEHLLGERRFHPSQEPPGWVDSMLGGWDTASGVTVTPDSSLQLAGVFACVRVLAESEGSLPLVLYRRTGRRGRERATDHPLYSLLHDSPNPEMTSIEFRETLTGHLATWGNAYAEIEWGRGGQVLGLWPLRVDRMRLERVNKQLKYIYRLPSKFGEEKVGLPAERVMHIRGLGSNGIIGYSPIYLTRQAMGLAIATEEFGGRFFSNSARPSAVLEHPGKLSPTAHTNLRDSWEEVHMGLSHSHRVAILEEGLSYKQIGLPPDEAQFIETRKFQLREIARIFRMQPHMIQDLEQATFSNIEHQGIEFVVHTLRAWLVRWEQRIGLSLLTPQERRDYYAEHLVDGLLRGDIQSRYAAYGLGKMNGFLSTNDIREKENMNPVEGGDVYMVPLNMVPAGTESPAGAVSVERGMAGRGEYPHPRPLLPADTVRPKGEGREMRARRSAAMRHRLMGAYRRIYAEALGRVIRREVNDVGAMARKLLGKRDWFEFTTWLEDFYKEHAEFTMRQLLPVAMSYGEVVAAEAQAEVGAEAAMTPELERFTTAYTGSYAARHAERGLKRLREAVGKAHEENTDPVEAVEAEMADWPESRGESEAGDEAVRFNNALAKTVYVMAGIIKLRSVAVGESCPYCRALDGRVIGINQWFISAGEEFQPEGAEGPLTSVSNLGHGPYHGGCDCMVTAAW